jgi:2-polyprenyl-3-methyl-5-hydroxy-6-metoxy-1,4-benzoquinol methylase
MEKEMTNLERAIKKHYDQGELLRAEDLAKRDPGLDISKEVLKRMEDIRSWNKFGKPHGYVDPDSWEQMPKFQRIHDIIKKEFKGKGVHLLDVGCFTGFFSRTMNKFGHDCHGCDIQSKLMKILNVRERSEIFHPVAAENISLYFTPGAFEVITFIDSIEHVLYDKAAINAAKQLLNPHGMIILHVPRNDLYPDTSKEHLRIYTKESFLDLLPGSKIEDCKDEHGNPTFLVYWKKGVIL